MFPDGPVAAVERALETLSRQGGVIPAIFRYEIRNTLVVGERRGCVDRADSARFLMRLQGLRLLRDDAHDEDAIMAFAREHGLSVYDAAYLETALRGGDTLATLDRDLARAAVPEGVALIH